MVARVRRVKAKIACAERQQARRVFGPLGANEVSPGVQRRYDFAVWYFTWFTWVMYGGMASTTATMERQLLEYIEACWAHGEPKGLVYDTLSGIQSIFDVRKCFPAAWKKMTLWNKLEQPRCAPPLPL